MTANAVILVLLLLSLKHFIFDFLYQPPYMWQNKGTYGHWGGIAHSLFHAVATCIILTFFTDKATAGYLAVLEYFIHYNMDWFKMWYNKKKGWTATTHNEFWILMGFDQLIHSLTYILIVYLLTI